VKKEIKIFRLLPGIPICLFVLIMSGCDSSLFKAKEVPVITDLTADVYEVNPGDTVQVTVSVEKRDDPALQYKWTANGGQFIPPVNQPKVFWKAPQEGGDYRLTVVVSNADGDSEPHSEVIVVRSKEAPEILSIQLDAYEVDPGDTVRISVTLKDMDDPTLDFQWTADGGQFLPPANQAEVYWKAPAVGGGYEIGLVVSNNKKQSEPRSLTVTVRSYAAPYVEITAPADGDVFLQYEALEVSAVANHQNGIESVLLYVNDILQTRQNGGDSENYQLSCELNGPEGLNEIRVEAVARITEITGSDAVQVRVEGIVLGK